MAKNRGKNFVVDTIAQKDGSESFYDHTKVTSVLIVREKQVTQTWGSCADVKHVSIELAMILFFAGFVAVCTMTLYLHQDPHRKSYQFQEKAWKGGHVYNAWTQSISSE